MNRDKRLIGIVSLADLAMAASVARTAQALHGISGPAVNTIKATRPGRELIKPVLERGQLAPSARGFFSRYRRQFRSGWLDKPPCHLIHSQAKEPQEKIPVEGRRVHAISQPLPDEHADRGR
jgi:hypothetical protein